MLADKLASISYLEQEPKSADDDMDDELEQVGGTAEDDIGDAIIRIREREILFNPKSLLARFGPILIEVCARNKVYTVRSRALWYCRH
jgi:condensin complex subunit 1